MYSFPFLYSASMEPPMRSVSSRAMERPSPVEPDMPPQRSEADVTATASD